jgi:membrane protease YdiL (CAAX protease family)
VKTSSRVLCAIAAAPVLLSGLVAGFYSELFMTNPGIFWIYDLINWIVVPGICLTIIIGSLKVKPADLGLVSIRHENLTAHALGRLATTVVLFLSFVVVQAVFFRILPPTNTIFNYVDLIPKGALGKVSALYLAVTAAFVEEIFYRGVLKWVMVNENPGKGAAAAYVVFSAVLFGLNHWGQGSFKVLATIYLGVITALLYLRFKNLWYLIAAHLLFNLTYLFWLD